MDWVRIGDDTVKDKSLQTVEEYEEHLKTKVKTRGFNLVYGNVLTGQFKYFQYQNTPN